MIEFTPWPDDLAALYRARGYWIDEPLTRCLSDQVRQRPDAPAIFCGSRVFSYAQMDRMSDALATYLRGRGLVKGDTALVQLPNVAEFYLVFFALLKIGVAPVNALFHHKTAELRAYAQQLEPALLIGARAHSAFADRAFADALQAAHSGLKTVLILGGDDPVISLEGAFSTAIAPNVADPSDAGQVAFFQLSGGSTGTPKLIPRTHNDYDYSLRASAEICGVTQATRLLCALPLAHNFMMSSPGALGVFHAGGSVVLAGSPDPAQCFDLIAAHGVTMASLVPPAVSLWLEAAADPQTRGKIVSLDVLQVGGAIFAAATARRVPVELGCRLQQVFGMAEGLVNYTRLDDCKEVIFSTQGRPISPDDELRILDEDGREVACGGAGELATRGPYTLRGYYKSPDQNAQAFDPDGFYKTGDLVERSPQGYLRVVGRVKDQINRGGEKIAAEEIENLLLRHDAIAQAALVGIADETLGEKSCAFVALRTGGQARPTGVSLRRYLIGAGIAEFKVPDRIRFVDQMPLTAVGKIDKKVLRAQFAREASDI
jgi:2,3-dihydroxybenzoate-AMP ligase